MSQILHRIHHIIAHQSVPRLQSRQTHLLGTDIYLPIVQLLVLFLLYCCNSCCSGGRRRGSGSSNSSGSSLSEVWGRPNAQTGTSTVSRVTAGEDREISGQWIECTSVWGFVMSMSQSSGRQQPRGHRVTQNPAEIAWNKQLYKFKTLQHYHVVHLIGSESSAWCSNVRIIIKNFAIGLMLLLNSKLSVAGIKMIFNGYNKSV